MTDKKDFKQRYQSGDIPWDIGKPDFNLIKIVTERPIGPCKVLDIGCGSGDNSIWLAGMDFTVTGVDLSEIAIKNAREKSNKANMKCTFMVGDFIEQDISGAPFELIFDRGCFHSFDSPDERNIFANKAATYLVDAGLWLSIIGSADDPPRKHGPPRLTAGEIVSVAEPHFEILSIVSSYLESKHSRNPRAWICLMKKRGQIID